MRSATIAMLENAGFPSVQAHAIVEAIEIVAQTRRGSGTTVVALRCWIEDRRVCLELSDQRQVSFPIMKYPSLAKASVSELEKVHIRRQG